MMQILSEAGSFASLCPQGADVAVNTQDGDFDGLISQNAYLKEALDTCRSDIASMSQQVRLPTRYISLLVQGSIQDLQSPQDNALWYHSDLCGCSKTRFSEYDLFCCVRLFDLLLIEIPTIGYARDVFELLELADG